MSPLVTNYAYCVQKNLDTSYRIHFRSDSTESILLMSKIILGCHSNADSILSKSVRTKTQTHQNYLNGEFKGLNREFKGENLPPNVFMLF